MNFKRAIIAYFPHKRMGNTGNKKIIFFAIMKPLSGELKTPTNTKKGLLSWKTKTLKQINLLH
ncbi:type I restriction endonuclease [Helicobacter pylori]|uniref:type I restriction endonuclease n=1 Tax=Helicobacter pylori TaxID=210 RepID=UPI001FD410EF|nr:type I restriction endonuclease [Helicobacter pylori]UOS23799.1 type I restriction endonuclease [Helicobacter pylori]